MDAVREALREDTALVTLMMVNNETGAVTDIAGIVRTLRAAKSKALLHTDAVQGFMKEPFSAKTLGADMISVSGHKVHAPKGIGALYIRQGLKLPAHILGGGQEEGLRSGTEPMPQIAAFGEAVRIAKAEMPEANKRMEALRAQCVQTLTDTVPGIVFSAVAARTFSRSLCPAIGSEVLMNYSRRRASTFPRAARASAASAATCSRPSARRTRSSTGRCAFRSRATRPRRNALIFAKRSPRRERNSTLPFNQSIVLKRRRSVKSCGGAFAATAARLYKIKGFLAQSPACREAFARVLFLFY